jgi:hypothetical protein
MMTLYDVALAYLNDMVLCPNGWTPLKHGFDLLEEGEWQVAPVSRGTYVLLAPSRLFTYPAGGSAVFYIGKASNLRRRLGDHSKYSRQVRNGEPNRYYPRYEWAGSLGANFCYSEPPPPKGNSIGITDEKVMEASMLTAFGNAFRAIPLANGGGGWS